MIEPAAEQDTSLRPALEALASVDADVAEAYARIGLPPVRSSPAGFAGLVRMIISQQVSVASARAILTRLDAGVGSIEPEAIKRHDVDSLRTMGLSRPKARYILDLADHFRSGQLSEDMLAACEDEELIERLVAVRGIGRWTAEIYLLFALQRPDVWPAGDLALWVSLQRLKSLDDRPTEKVMRKMGDIYRPYRSAMARFLWHAYRHDGLA